jgi:hypothetical protein
VGQWVSEIKDRTKVNKYKRKMQKDILTRYSQTERGTEIQREGNIYRETDIQETEKEEKNKRVLKGKNLDDAE